MSDKKALSSKCQFSVRILLPLRIFCSPFLGYCITFKRKLQETPGLTSEGFSLVWGFSREPEPLPEATAFP